MATTIMRAAELIGVTDELLAENNDLTIATNLAKEYGKSHQNMGGSDYSIGCERQGITLDEHDESKRRYTWLQFVQAVRLVTGERATLIAIQNNGITTLREIEVRIHAHLQAAYSSVLEVGRCLIEAKEKGLVPHGQWEAWVRTHAHMSERAAQKLMQAAREVAPGSRMESLPISKIQEILALPEPDRETMAQRALDEDMTVKQLREAIAGEKRRSEQLLAKYNRVNDARLKLSNALTQEQGRLKQVRGQYEDEKRATDEEHRREIGALRIQLDEAMAAPKGISPEAEAEIHRLEAELADAEAMAEYQAGQRQQAQQELMEMKSRSARSNAYRADDDITAEEVAASVRTFVSMVGYLPHSNKLAALDDADRQTVAGYVGMVAQWASEMTEALTYRPYVVEV